MRLHDKTSDRTTHVKGELWDSRCRNVRVTNSEEFVNLKEDSRFTGTVMSYRTSSGHLGETTQEKEGLEVSNQ